MERAVRSPTAARMKRAKQSMMLCSTTSSRSDRPTADGWAGARAACLGVIAMTPSSVCVTRMVARKLVRFNGALYGLDHGGRHFALTIDRLPDTEIADLE